MEKQRQMICIGLLLVLLTTINLSGCIDEKSKIIGTWRTTGRETTFTFTNNIVIISGPGPWDSLR